MRSPADLQRVASSDAVSGVGTRLPVWVRIQRWSLLLIIGNLLALRLVVFATARGDLGFAAKSSWVGVAWPLLMPLLLIQSLSLEFLVLRAVDWAVARPLLRWPARLGLFIFLIGEVAATKCFWMVGTYTRGFQLIRVPAGETGSVISGVADPLLLAATAFVAIPALVVAPLSAAALSPRARAAVRGLTLFALLAVAAQLAFPAALSTAAYSPWLLTVEREQPGRIPYLATATPAPEDWAPARQLAPAWRGLEGQPRAFNIVVVVLESLRAESLWPAPTAPPMPRLAARAKEAAVFTRAYAHEPWSHKGLEAILFGVYPSPFFDSFAGHRSGVALESMGSRWTELGLRTGFFGHGEIPGIGEAPFLQAHGFKSYVGGNELRLLEAHPSDHTLVKAFANFLDGAPAARFGVLLWPHGTHLPYAVPGSAARPATLAAYRESVTALDGLLGELFDALAARGLAEDTVVVLVGDHGESFGEHPASGLGHGSWLFEETAHVPLVLLNARLFHGERDGRIVQQKDVAATVGWLAGDSRPQLNLGSSIFFQRASETAYLVNRYDASELRGGMVRSNDGFVIGRATPRDIPPGKLFDLASDPLERHDLAGRDPKRLEELQRRYFGWLETWTQRWMVIEDSGTWDDPEAVARALHLPSAASTQALGSRTLKQLPRPAAPVSSSVPPMARTKL